MQDEHLAQKRLIFTAADTPRPATSISTYQIKEREFFLNMVLSGPLLRQTPRGKHNVRQGSEERVVCTVFIAYIIISDQFRFFSHQLNPATFDLRLQPAVAVVGAPAGL